MSERLNRIEPGCFAGRKKTEDNANCRGKQECDHDNFYIEQKRDLKRICSDGGGPKPQNNTDNTTEAGKHMLPDIEAAAGGMRILIGRPLTKRIGTHTIDHKIYFVND